MNLTGRLIGAEISLFEFLFKSVFYCILYLRFRNLSFAASLIVALLVFAVKLSILVLEYLLLERGTTPDLTVNSFRAYLLKFILQIAFIFD